ncbi:hypothetical protein M8J75_008300 [Diaphorina citri]|nr:hypothetical protein M8J75_008300 [Diaphorina citri]KAI5755535.1 hypothetical protein M8J77_017796 [Diaphorina citri]
MMKLRILVLLFLISWHETLCGVVSVDDCTEPGAHRYHAHSSHSAAYTSGYSQQHPAPIGHSATSSSYMRTGNAASSRYTQGEADDLQVASSYYSPSVATGGYGYHSSGNEVGSSGYTASDSHVRQKYEDLKHKADAFVHSGAPPPASVGSFSGVPISSSLGSTSSTSQHSSQYQQRYGATSGGNILGVTYGSTGTDEDDTQKFVPVPATLPAASALTTGAHKETHDSSISYSTSGVARVPSDGVDFSISQNVPVGTTSHSEHIVSQDFEQLKRKAQAFVHEGGPPPSSSSSSSHLTSGSTVETLPVKSTSHGTIVVPVRVTVTREHTVLPGGVTSQQQESSYTSHSSSTQPHTVSYVQSGNTAGSADSSYSYNAQGVKVAPQVYTVGSQGSVYIPEGSSVSHQHQSNVRQDNVIVPGAVPILNSEEALRKSNKLFDLVSGYGTFLPAKEEEHVEKSSSSSSSIQSGSQYGSQSQYSVRGEHESSAEYHSRVTGSGSEYHRVYQPSASSYITQGSGTGYQGVIPAGGGVKKTTTVYSSYSSNQGLGSQISPGVPVGDTINPPEVSGSYFSAGGAGGRRYATRTGYATSGGYGVRNENYGYSGASRDAALSSGYGVKNSGLSSSYAANANTLASGYAANANRDAALTQNLALNRDYTTAVCPTVCPVIEPNCILPVCDTSTGGVKKYGISSSWSSKSQTVNGKTTESKQAQVTVNDNGKIDTYSTHNRK